MELSKLTKKSVAFLLVILDTNATFSPDKITFATVNIIFRFAFATCQVKLLKMQLCADNINV